METDARYIKGILSNPDIQPSASINRWILSILTFHFDLVHVKGIFHGPDRLLQCPRQPGDMPSEEENFDFEDWIDNLHGLLHVIQPLAGDHTKAILNGQIAEEGRIEEFSKNKEFPKGLEISYEDVPRSEKAEQEDHRLGLVEKLSSLHLATYLEGGPIRQPTLRGDQIRQDQSIFVAQKWEPIVNTSKKRK